MDLNKIAKEIKFVNSENTIRYIVGQKKSLDTDQH